MTAIIVAHPETPDHFVPTPIADDVWRAAQDYARKENIKIETLFVEALRAYLGINK